MSAVANFGSSLSFLFGASASSKTTTATTSAKTTTTSQATSSTSEKSFAQVTLDARAALDAGYQKLGKTADYETTGAQWSDTLGLKSLDRRTLYAISSNQGGMFSQVEMDAAKIFMEKQEGDVITAADPLHTNPSAAYKAATDFLDSVSSEEKSSLEWAQERGTAQAGYLLTMKNAGRAAANVDTGNPIVNLFAKSYAELAATKNASLDPRNMPSWQQAVDLWTFQAEETPSISWTV
ncbi:hypothetical protein CCR94_12670 [Rhodoblastus sphagnicola]|uniref:Uncharacterized protein n=1 Tax=Rhodoblastus sphagnicola TaxID=333368 RepID=A0A2S6N6Z8_9HYPH|nr:hypothetical protein [Rhodoblastus sphagnicola]MBB4200744.1 hypothetical protein [Rhodoblastus sphagnicola]PPQ30383.1 hypothetical protein CCR94_12670 [Rhodoblastus sphagnicola]